MAATWPPTVVDLKADSGADKLADDDATARSCVAAAVSFVERVRPDAIVVDELTAVKSTDAETWLGTVRLAWRWYTRRLSPDALVSLGDLGSSRVPSFDPDIDRLLKIGLYAGVVIA